MTSNDDDREPQADRLERMKSEFLAAQQRRREKAAADATARRGEATDEAPVADRATDGLNAVAFLRP